LEIWSITGAFSSSHASTIPEEFHVVDVERAQRVFALQRLRKKFLRMCQWHKFFRFLFQGKTARFSQRKKIIARFRRKEIKNAGTYSQ
jgi:hypothetical protein